MSKSQLLKQTGAMALQEQTACFQLHERTGEQDLPEQNGSMEAVKLFEQERGLRELQERSWCSSEME